MSLTTDLEVSLASGDWEPTGETLDQIVQRDLSHRPNPTLKSHAAAVAAPGVAGSGLADFLAFALSQQRTAAARASSPFHFEALRDFNEASAVLNLWHKFEMARISGI